MKADSFCSIICDIQHAADLSDGQKKRLLLLVYYIKDTDISLLKNIHPKRISEITGDSEKETILDVLYFLCGHKWHLLESVYRYTSLYDKEPIELEEDELTEIREIGYIYINNGRLRSVFDPSNLFITFTISENAKKLKTISDGDDSDE